MVGSSLDGAGGDAGKSDPTKLLLPIITDLTAKHDPNFALPSTLTDTFLHLALGSTSSPTAREIWKTTLTKTYSGEAGRIKLRQATTMVLSRDSLYLRAPDLKMPLLWIQGSEDAVMNLEIARRELALTGSVDPRLEVVQGGPHSCHTTHPQVVNELLREFVVSCKGRVEQGS
jgi:pimeloyl-ACP methyl ester carboxylesterase